MKFDVQSYPYSSKRNVIYSKNSMAASGNPQVSAAALEILKKGGNAVDAIIAMAVTQTVVEPTGNGIGSDNFALIHMDGNLYGLNGSGPSPKKLTRKALVDRDYESIPSYGVEPINVPGTPAGWAAMHEKFGSLDFEELFKPAIKYAREGYVVQPNVARLWDEAFEIYSKQEKKEEFKPWFDTFSKDGRAYQAGEVFKSEDQAKTLEILAKTKCRDFYEGELAKKIVDFIKEHDGFMELSDLEGFEAEWVEPISTNYRGYDIWEIPPNGHGITVLMALNILKEYEFEFRDTTETMHTQIEALKLAFTDTKEFVAEPSRMKYTVEELLSQDYARHRKELIGYEAIEPTVGDPKYNSTVYFCCADKDGNMVSMIQSNFRGFGSGIVIPGTGIAMNDRAENFSFKEGHYNVVDGGYRPYHTIIPAFITKDDKPISAFGIMGGFMQPQAHVQVVMNMIDFNLNPQSALDAPRWQWVGGKKVEVEQDTPNHIIRELQRRGHDIIVQPDPYHMGRGQIIIRDHENGVYLGATEKRHDGSIAID